MSVVFDVCSSALLVCLVVAGGGLVGVSLGAAWSRSI